jgi:lipopolysaccharide transport system permease protein
MSSASPIAPAETPALVIQPRRGWIGIDFAELYHYRELLYFLVWRDFKVKYKQAVLGVLWSVILPLMSLSIYGTVAAVARWGSTLSDPQPPVLLWMFAGLIPWMFLQRSITDGGNALLNNQALMTKIYLPRLYLPAAACGNAFVDMAINLVLFTGIAGIACLRTGWTPTWHVVFIIPLMLLTWICALGIAFTLSAATVLYRDIRLIIPFIVQFGLWLSAVPQPMNLTPNHKAIYAINPLTGIIYGFRSALTGQPWEWLHLGTSIVLSLGLLMFGLFYFRRVERRFADIA